MFSLIVVFVFARKDKEYFAMCCAPFLLRDDCDDITNKTKEIRNKRGIIVVVNDSVGKR